MFATGNILKFSVMIRSSLLGLFVSYELNEVLWVQPLGLYHKTFYSRNQLCNVLSLFVIVNNYNFLLGSTNTLAFYIMELITTEKKFMMQAPGWDVISILYIKVTGR